MRKRNVRSALRAVGLTLALIAVPVPVIAQSFDAACNPTMFDRLALRARAGLEREMATLHALVENPTSVTRLSCLQNLLSFNGNWFSPGGLFQGLINQFSNYICSEARNQFYQYTRPLSGSMQVPGFSQYGFMGGQGSSWSIGGGRPGINLGGENWNPVTTMNGQGSSQGWRNPTGNIIGNTPTGGGAGVGSYTAPPTAGQRSVPQQSITRPPQGATTQPSTGTQSNPLQGLFR